MKKAVRKGLIIVAVGLLVVAVLSAASYTYYTARIASEYIDGLQAKTSKLHTSLNKLATTTNSRVFTDPSTAQANKDNIALITIANQKTSSELTSYVTYSKSLREFTFANYFGPYKQAKIKQRLAANIVSQSQDVIASYQKTLDYLVALNDTQDIFERKTGEINAVVIVNTLDPNRISQDAEELSQAVQKLAAHNVPQRLQESKNGMIEVMNQTILGYESVATALRSGSEAGLDNAFKQIEGQVQRYDEVVKQQAEKAIDKSVIIDDVNDLPTKTSLLLSIH